MKILEETLVSIEGLNKEKALECEKLLNGKMKPLGSLGVLEKLAIQISGIKGKIEKLNNGCHIIVSGDNGIIEENVSSCPLEYTKIVSEAMVNKIAAIGILCNSLGIDLQLVDVGINGDIERKYKNLYVDKVMNGTKNFKNEPAMSLKECTETIERGIKRIESLKDKYDFFSNGEMGIGNTTTSSGILYALTKKSLDEVVGRGGGLSDEGLKRKKNLIKESIIKYDLFNKGPLEILRTVGGLDIASMVGLYLGCAKYKKPMLIDGFISGIGALVAVKMEPKVKDYLIATHMSQEPGMKIIMEELNLTPFLNMEMRLGEGTGAVLAYPILKSAMEIPLRMKTKDEVYKIFS
ncbi:MAG: nicotinate-nucleotide--dimethylbenzimidazole phosphoribosyltransferase [Cetobacterium sp.]|nr:nicotinate-nucleotide--dimethylbenzimidazole phosphoribosyltransferase [Cetobacterium sp.]